LVLYLQTQFVHGEEKREKERPMKLLLVAPASLLAALGAVAAQEQDKFDNCSVDTYYTSLDDTSDSWTVPQLFQLLNETHRQNLRIFGGVSANDALIDLDPGFEASDEPTVRLHMRDVDFDAALLNIVEGWKRADLWPHERNAGPNTYAGTDIHAKRPVDWQVNSVIATLFWGECGKVADPDMCVSPAVPDQNTAPTTAQDGKIKTPPESMRGDIARSLFYTQVRYSGDLNLVLTDCPPFEPNEYGYLSELLRWHKADPVDEREKVRNDKACSKWQGNRNPFVDYPGLASRLFGEPDDIMEGTRTYSKCKETTMPPTATPNACSSLEPGDVNVIIFNSDPADQIVFYTINDIPASVGSLFVTNRVWDGEGFVTEDGTLEVRFACSFVSLLTPTDRMYTGTLQYILPATGIKAGAVFGYGVTFPSQEGEWAETEEQKMFDLRTVAADSMLVYCMDADGRENFLSAVTYNNDGFGSGPGQTSLPENLVEIGSLALQFAPNYLYTGPLNGTRTALLEALSNASNFKGSKVPYEINTSTANDVRASLLFASALIALAVIFA
jgi:endonuclease I